MRLVRRARLALIVALPGCSGADPATRGVHHYQHQHEHAVVVIGQSNARGPGVRSPLRHPDLVTDLRLDGTTLVGPEFSNQGGPGSISVEGVQPFRNLTGEYLSLGRLLADELAEHGPVTFLSAARGGLDSASWMPDNERRLTPATLALLDGRQIDALVIYQGETDALHSAADWASHWSEALAAWPVPDRIVVVRLAVTGPPEGFPAWQAVRDRQAEFCRDRGVVCVDPAGGTRGALHLDPDELRATAASIAAVIAPEHEPVLEQGPERAPSRAEPPLAAATLGDDAP